MKYIKRLSLATHAINEAFLHNESKHGVGLKFLNEAEDEVVKAIGHIRQHMFDEVENTKDNCLHLTSAACRILKALEKFLEENPQYEETSSVTNSDLPEGVDRSE